jgi:hypothetical protein
MTESLEMPMATTQWEAGLLNQACSASIGTPFTLWLSAKPSE